MSTHERHVVHGGPVRRRAGDPGTISEALAVAAERAPEAGVGVVGNDGSVRFTPYPVLLERARRVLAGLRAWGVAAGQDVILQIPTIDGYLTALWAALLGGIRPVALACPPDDDPAERAHDRMIHAWRLLDRPVILGAGGAPYRPVDGMRVVDLAACAGTEPVDAAEAPAIRGTDVALHMLSSGSTGRAKIIPLTQRGLVQLGIAAREQMSMEPGDATVNWLPLDHSGALLLYHVVPVFVGATNLHAPTDWVLADPLRWLDLVAEHGVNHAWAPTFGYRLVTEALRAAPTRHYALSGVKTLVSGGEQVIATVVDDFLDATAGFGVTPRMFTPVWGMAETCTAIAFGSYADPGAVRHVRRTSLSGPLDFLDQPGPDVTTFVGVGTPAPGAEFRVVDHAGNALPERHIGRLQVRSIRVTPGYVNDPEATRAALRGDGWLHTGDLAFLADGWLTITGREKDIIILNGENHLCHEIEEVVATVPGVAPGRVAALGVPDEARGTEVLAIVFVPAGPPDGTVPQEAGRLTATIRREVAVRLGLTTAAVIPVPEAQFPLTTSGKIQRAALRERLISGELQPEPAPAPPAPAVGDRAGLHRQVMLAFRGVLGTEVDPGRPFYEQGIDSVRLPALSAAVQRALGRRVVTTELLRHPTVDALVKALVGAESAPYAVPARAAEAPAADRRIAIIGMAIRFPGATTVDAFWDNICQGTDSIRFFPPQQLAAALPASEYQRPDYVPASGALDDIASFDADLFGISAREAALIDPQQRLFLECCHEALEQAGYAGDDDLEVGVFAGCGMNLYPHRTYLLRNLAPAGALADQMTAMQVAMGNQPDFLATRVAYRLGLTGPAMSVQAACSTGLVAVDLATRTLLAGDADLALAGAAALHVPPVGGYSYVDGAMLSPTGRCRPFDADADGTVGGNGVAAVVLKRLDRALADGDTIHAVILGSAVNNDGATKVGFTAPSVAGQVRVVTAALDAAGVPAETIGYLEAHGTGTRLGDPLEVQALREAFADRISPDAAGRQGFCGLGSVKANIGHLDSCAGLAGLVKAALALRHGIIPPQINVHRVNPAIALDGGPFYLARQARQWPRGSSPRRAGVHALGVGGTNAHVVLEEPPRPAPVPEDGWAPALLPLSAHTQPALRALAAAFRDRLCQPDPPRLADLFVTVTTGRRHRRHRLVASGDSARELAGALDAYLAGEAGAAVSGEVPRGGPGPSGFAFSGQGSPGSGGARDLYRRYRIFRDVVDRCADQYRALGGGDLLGAVLDGADRDGPPETDVAQPALFTLQVALAELWRWLGTHPDYVIGHSVGEYAAWCVAGGLSIEDGVALTAARGSLMRERTARGAMAAVLAERGTVDEVHAAVPGLDLAVVNGPREYVLAGEPAAVERATALLQQRGAAVRVLPVNRAFHSALLEPMLPELRSVLGGIRFTPTRLPLASTVDGELRPAGTVADADYFCRQTRDTARFDLALARLTGAGCRQFIEIGPDTVLSGLGRRSAAQSGWVPSLRPGVAGTAALAAAVARLYCAGLTVDWRALGTGCHGRRVPLPTYPFERKRYWIEPAPATAGAPMAEAGGEMSDEPGKTANAETVSIRVLDDVRGAAARQLGRDAAEVGPDDSFFDLGADSLLLVGMLRELERMFGVRVAMRELFTEADTARQLSQLIVARMSPRRLTAPAAVPPTSVAVDAATDAAAPAAPAPPAAVTTAPAVPPATVAPPFTVAPSPAVSWPVPGSDPVNAQYAAMAAAQVQLLAQFASLVAQQLGAQPGLPQPPAPQPSPPLAAAPGAQPSPPLAAASAQPANPVPRAGTGGPASAAIHGPRVEVARATGMVNAASTPGQRAHLDDLIQRFVARTKTSKSIAQRDRRALADSRAIVGFRDATKEMLYPIAAESAMGSRLRDVDGNSYIDITMGFGALLFGHEPDFVAEALRAHLSAGLRLGPRSEDTGIAARLLAELTGMERVAFACTGSEAVAGAVRLARAYTGRDRIVTFNGSYHGHADLVLGRTAVENGRRTTVGVSPGIPTNAVADLTVLDYGDPASLGVIEELAGEVAAVVVEPVQSRHPARQPAEFLHRLRELTSRHGIVLMFDEMLTGLRCHPGGAQAHFGVTADIATYGKALASGYPIGAIAGRAELLDGVDGGFWRYGDDSYPPRETTFFGGTYIQHPLSMAVARAVLEKITVDSPALQLRLNRRTDEFAVALNRFFADEEFPVRIVHFGSQFRFDYRGDMELLFFHLLERGVYVWEWRNFFWSTAHTDSDVEFVMDAVKGALRDMRRAGFFPHRGPAVAGARPEPKPAPQPAPGAGPLARGQLDFSVYFFGDYPHDLNGADGGKYDLIQETVRFADAHGFHAVWLPERHFHSFGGLFPSPSVLAAGLATQTHRIRLHAGSVVLPLHNPIRVAEEWSVVDNLSNGRVGLCVASGWHANDFAFFPERYGKHKQLMYSQLDVVRRLWSGQGVPATSGTGEQIEVRLYPSPVQPMPPLFTAVVGNPDSYRLAAQHDLGIVTNLMTQSVEQLAENIRLYRNTRAEHGLDPAAGRVVVLLHAYLEADADRARQRAAEPFCAYLRSSLSLLGQATNSLGMSIDVANTPEDDLQFLLKQAYQRYCESRALIGSPDTCTPIVDAIRAAGADEIAYFLDFGVPADLVRDNLPLLDELRSRYSPPTADGDGLDIAPLTYAQERIWLVESLYPDRTVYNEPKAIRLTGRLDMAALRAALRRLVARHAALRTVIREIDGEPRQVVLASTPVDCPTQDCAGQDEAAAVREAIAQEARRRFDLANGPLFLARLLRFGPHRHVLVISAHHAVIDTISGYVLARELSTCYRSYLAGEPAELPPLARSYAEHARIQRSAGADEQFRRDLEFWREQLTGDLPVLTLPTDRPRPAVLDPTGANLVEYLPAELTDRARRFSGEQRSTLFSTLLAALVTTLHRFTGQEDLLVGTAVADRPEGAEDLVGVLLNTLALRLDVSGDPSFEELARRVRDTVVDAHEHSAVPFERVLKELKVARDPSRSPLFQVMVIYENEGVYSFELPDITVTLLDDAPDRALFDLTVYLTNLPDGVRVHAEYNTALFEESSIRRLVSYFAQLLESALADPGRPISRLDQLTDDDRALLDGWQRGPVTAVEQTSIDQLVAQQAARTPDAVAVESGADRLSYAQLDARAEAVARRLRAAGVGRGSIVAIHLPRCPGLVVAELGVLKAGGAYLPIEPGLPAERIQFMLDDARCRAIVGDETYRADGRPVVRVDEAGNAVGAGSGPQAAPEGEVRRSCGDLAYVIYTSGSTGQPKAVASPHRGVVNLCQWYRERTGLASGDRTTFVSAVGFDASVLELWPALSAGATVVVPEETTRLDAGAVARWLAAARITVAWLPTRLADALLDEAEAVDVPSRIIVTGGSALRRRPPSRLRFELVNTYGPTEASVIATHATVRPNPSEDRPVPIGRPLSNVELYVLDERRRRVPVGVAGELYLGGVGLADGYLNRPELTAERFVPDPFGGPGRLYRTGDLVRWNACGELEFLGRNDDQVKIRGYRIEPGEVAHALRALPGVLDAAVVATGHDPDGDHRNEQRGDGGTGDGASLVAYVVPAEPTGNGDSPELAAKLVAALGEVLPDLMVPRRFAFVSSLPQTASGKLDRAALPAADVRATGGGRGPRTPLEQTLHDLWCRELRLDEIPVDASFFDLGGDSLAAARLLNRVRSMMDTELLLLDFFQRPTIAAMAARLSSAHGHIEAVPVPAGRVRGSL